MNEGGASVDEGGPISSRGGSGERSIDVPWVRYAVVAVVGVAVRIHYALTVSLHKPLDGDSYFFYYWPAVQLARGNGFVSWESALFDDKLQAFLAAQNGHITRQLAIDTAARNYPVLIPDAAHPPGFTGMLAVLYRFGFQSPNAMTVWICVLGGATIVLTGLLVREMVGRRAGLIAAIGMALYPSIWVVDTQLLSESLLVFGFVLGAYGTYRHRSSRGWKSMLVASSGFTIAASARPESILLFPFVVVPLVLGARGDPWARRARMLGVAALLPVAVFGGWFVYNLGRLEKPVFLSTGFGQTAAVGTCDKTFDGQWIGYYHLSCLDEYPEPPTAGKGSVDGSVKNDFYTRAAWGYTKDHLGDLPKVLVAREGRTFGVWNPPQMAQIDHFVDQRGSLGFVTFTQRLFWVLALVSIAGVVVLRRRRVPTYPLFAEVGVTMGAVALTFGQTRYRIGIDVCVVVLSAVAVDAAWQWLSTRRRQRQTHPAETSVEPSVHVIRSSERSMTSLRDMR